jgi:hypothetical protein
MFDFSKALKNAFKVGADFFLGGGQGNVVDTVFDAGMDVERSKGGGFLDTALGLVSTGAKAYRAMQDDPDGNVFQTPEFQRPDIRRVGTGGGRAGRGGLTGRTGWRPTNQMYRDAIIRRMKQVNFESNLQRMTASTTVSPNIRRKAAEKPGTTTIKRTTKAKVIT